MRLNPIFQSFEAARKGLESFSNSPQLSSIDIILILIHISMVAYVIVKLEIFLYHGVKVAFRLIFQRRARAVSRTKKSRLSSVTVGPAKPKTLGASLETLSLNAGDQTLPAKVTSDCPKFRKIILVQREYTIKVPGDELYAILFRSCYC